MALRTLRGDGPHRSRAEELGASLEVQTRAGFPQQTSALCPRNAGQTSEAGEQQMSLLLRDGSREESRIVCDQWGALYWFWYPSGH